MQIAGIVAEYNPFHRGHAYQIAKTRQLGATHVVSVMSGHVVQRGDIPIMDKWARTKAALLGGVDLVLELPAPFALASAQRFAEGAVFLLNALGCVDTLSFGSECGSLAPLLEAAEALETAAVQRAIADFIAQGLSYPAALAKGLGSVAPDAAPLLAGANNTLGLEYLQALRRLQSPIRPVTVPRRGAAHDGMEEDVFPSASYLRQSLLAGSFPEALPEATAAILKEELKENRAPLRIDRLQTALLATLRQSTPGELLCFEEIGEGLENRILRCAQSRTTLGELCEGIKAKRYTMARIRRILLRILLRLTTEETPSSPPYLRVLGFNPRGMEILKAAKSTAHLPIIQRAADLRGLPPQAQALYRLECRITDVLGLCAPVQLNGNREKTMEPIRLKEELENEPTA